MSTVLTKNLSLPPVCEKEVLRYAGCRQPEEGTEGLLSSCLQEAKSVITGRVCYTVLPVTVLEDTCDFGAFSVTSRHLAETLRGCEKTLLFAATVGVGLDRLIAKYSRISPAKALMLQAIGAERIEALCDAFSREFSHEQGVFLRPRFSPGYGDLPLSLQKEIFALLDCPRTIGLTLTDSLLMSPTKSVTAFAGLTEEKAGDTIKCARCEKTDCVYRGAI